MPDDESTFLIEQSRNRDAGYEYNEELALDAQQQEEEAKIWQSTKYVNHDSEESDKDDLYKFTMGSWCE